MPIVSSDLKFFKSDNPGSTGGAITAEELVGDKHELFPVVTGDQAQSGIPADFRKFFIKNTHSSLTLFDAKVYLSFVSLPAGVSIALAKGTVADTSPSAPFVDSSNLLGDANTVPLQALSVGDIPAGGSVGIWVRRIVNAGVPAANNVRFDVIIRGDTGA